MARLPLPSVDEMTSEQREVHDEIVSGVRGRLVGPLRAVIHSPDLARRWSRLGEYLRFSTCLPKKLNELAIIVTGRRWNSQLEFLIHAEAAEAAGTRSVMHRSDPFRRGADVRGRRRSRGLRVCPPAAGDRKGRRAGARGGDGSLGRPRSGRADRGHRLLHDGFDDAECTRNSNPNRCAAAAVPAEQRRPDDTTEMPAGKSESVAHVMTGTLAPHMPHWTLPDGACDCHAHVFGLFVRFLIIHTRCTTSPPLAPSARSPPQFYSL